MAAILTFWPNCVDICSQCKAAGTIKKKVQLCDLFLLSELSEEKKKDNEGGLKMCDEPK